MNTWYNTSSITGSTTFITNPTYSNEIITFGHSKQKVDVKEISKFPFKMSRYEKNLSTKLQGDFNTWAGEIKSELFP